MRDGMTEAFFLNAYGAPLLQAMVGLGGPKEAPRRSERDLVREAAAAELRSSLGRKFEEGGLEEAALRALITCDCRAAPSTSAAFVCSRTSESSGSRRTASRRLNSGTR